jgi:antitoxin HicB
MRFKVVVRSDPEDGGFNVSCPALPGCHSQGYTEQEAVENIKDATQGCLDVLNDRVKKEGPAECFGEDNELGSGA